MIKTIVTLTFLGTLFIGCGSDATQERVALEQLEKLEELKASKLYQDNSNASDWDKVTAALASEGEQE